MADERSGQDPSPTGDMLTAHLLAMIKGWSGYGYELAQRLEEAGLGGYNRGSIYRTLRQMERVGLVSSMWDTSAEGPARRMYTLTAAGALFLTNWMELLEAHRRGMEQLLGIGRERREPGSGPREPRGHSPTKGDEESAS